MWARAFYRRHRERINAERAADPEYQRKNRERAQRWYWANRERAQAYERSESGKVRKRRWVQAHQDVRTADENTRRLKKLSNGGSHTLQEWLEKCELLGNVCFYCGESKPLTRDHNVPIVRGGTDDITNVLPACGSCNSRKRTKTAREFIANGATVAGHNVDLNEFRVAGWYLAP